jgi:hypothetical protein
MMKTRDSNGAYLRYGNLKPLIENPTSTAQYHARVATLRQQRGAKSWEKDQQRAREEQFCFLGNSTAAHKKGNCLSQKAIFLVSVTTTSSVRNGF